MAQPNMGQSVPKIQVQPPQKKPLSPYQHLLLAFSDLPEQAAKEMLCRAFLIWIHRGDTDSANKVQQAFGRLHADRITRKDKQLRNKLRKLTSLAAVRKAIEEARKKGGKP